MFEKGHIPWNKGLKAKDDERVKKSVEACHKATKGKPAWNKGKSLGFVSAGAFKKGNVPWNKGLTKKNDERVLKLSNKLSKIKKGKPSPFSLEVKKEIAKKVSLALSGKKLSDSHKKALSDAAIKKFENGFVHWNWKGGKTKKNDLIRHSHLTKEWREKVFKKDNYTCQVCKETGRRIVAHHIQPFAKYPDKRFDLDNGMVLCKSCHLFTHSKKFDAHTFYENTKIKEMVFYD